MTEETFNCEYTNTPPCELQGANENIFEKMVVRPRFELGMPKAADLQSAGLTIHPTYQMPLFYCRTKGFGAFYPSASGIGDCF